MRCSICHTRIQEGHERCSCPACEQIYHKGCWDDLGGCATYGCSHAVPAEKPPPPALLGAGWGDSKTCPACGKSIPASLLVCRCRAQFPYAEPMTRGEYQDWKAERQRLASTRRTLGVLFLLSLLGFTAPVLGAIAGVLAYKRRHDLAGADGTYLALGYGTAAIGTTYSLVMLLLLFGM